MARTGRPHSENPLKYDIKVRLDEETFDRLNEACEISGSDRAAFIRGAVIDRLDAFAGGQPADDRERPAGMIRKPGPPAKTQAHGEKKAIAAKRAPGPADTKTPARAAAAREAKAAYKEAEKRQPVNHKLDVWLM